MQNGGGRGRGGGARGPSRMRMDDPSFNPNKRKRDEEGDPALHLLSLVLRIGDRLRASCCVGLSFCLLDLCMF